MDASDFNPYAPPLSPVISGTSTGGCYRRGSLLIVPRPDAPYFPCDSCVRCGQPAASTLRRKLSWFHPAWFLLIIVNLLVFLIVAVCVSKRMTLTVGICAKHRATRKAWILASWLCFLAGIAFFVLFGRSGHSESFRLMIAGVGCILLSLILACVVSSLLVRPRRITPLEATLAGAGESFLQQFPPA